MKASDGANIAVVTLSHTSRPCVVCGHALDGHWWIVRYPEGVHERCRDWRGTPFPFTRQVRALRSFLTRAPVHRGELARLASALEGLRRRWPDDALPVLTEGRALVRDARALLEDLPPRLRAQL